MLRYRNHRKNLYVFLAMNLVFEVLLYIYLLLHKDYIVANLADAYRDIAIEKIERIFLWGTAVDFSANCLLYFYAFKSVTSH